MSLSGNKVLMTLSNTPLLKLEPSIQLGQRPALPQRLPAPLRLPHSSIITQFFFLRSTHPAGHRGSAAAKTMQLTHLNDSDFLCHHPPIHFLQDPIAELPERCRTFLTLSLSYVAHHWILHLIFCKNRPTRYYKSHVSATHVNLILLTVTQFFCVLAFWHISEYSKTHFEMH